MSNKDYIVHLIECQCILPIYKNKTKPLYHKFKVFSVIEDDQIEEKYVMCNNCKILHRVTEFNKSEIMWGVEEEKSMVTTIDDIKFNLSDDYPNIVRLFEEKEVDITAWEHFNFLVEEGISDSVLISKTENKDKLIYKVVEFNNNKAKIKNEIVQRYL